MKDIKNFQNEIISIEERINSIDEQLDSTRKEISESGWGDAQLRDKLRTLKDDRNILETVLEEKRETLAELEKQFEREQKIEELKDLAKDAKVMQENYSDLLNEIDDFLASKIPELVKVHGSWKKIGMRFNRIADGMNKGFKWATSRHLSVNDRLDEKTSDKLIEELEATGVDLDAVLSETALNHKNYNHLRRGVNTDSLNFIMAIYDMMNQRNIPELMEREPETA